MATIQITITNDDGSIADAPLATMPQAVLDMAIAAVCAAYNYQATVPNPDYVTPVVDLSIPQTLPNPLTPARFLTTMWRVFTTDHVSAYAQNQLASAQATINAQVAAMQSQVEITG